MHLQANPLNMTNLFGSLVFCSENEDEDDYDYDEEEEEEYWRINKHNRKLSVARMKTEKCQNTAQSCT